MHTTPAPAQQLRAGYERASCCGCGGPAVCPGYILYIDLLNIALQFLLVRPDFIRHRLQL